MIEFSLGVYLCRLWVSVSALSVTSSSSALSATSLLSVAAPPAAARSSAVASAAAPSSWAAAAERGVVAPQGLDVMCVLLMWSQVRLFSLVVNLDCCFSKTWGSAVVAASSSLAAASLSPVVVDASPSSPGVVLPSP